MTQEENRCFINIRTDTHINVDSRVDFRKRWEIKYYGFLTGAFVSTKVTKYLPGHSSPTRVSLCSTTRAFSYPTVYKTTLFIIQFDQRHLSPAIRLRTWKMSAQIPSEIISDAIQRILSACLKSTHILPSLVFSSESKYP